MTSERRSRRGCRQCRAKHHKCDEVRPVCARCRRSGSACEYGTGWRWEPVTTAQHGHVPRRSQRTGNVGLSRSRVRPHRASAQRLVASRIHTPAARTSPSAGSSYIPGGQEPCKLPSHHSLGSTVFRDQDEMVAYAYFMDRITGELQARDSAENPYRVIAASAISHPVLLYTVISCATEHMCASGHCHVSLAISHNNRAIRTIRLALGSWAAAATSCHDVSHENALPGPSGSSMSPTQALLTALLLYSAVIAFSDSNTASVTTFVSSAFHILESLGYLVCSSRPAQFLPRLLVQRFAMVDLGLSIYHRRRPHITGDYWIGHVQNSQCLNETNPSFLDMIGYCHNVYVFLLGAAHLAADTSQKARSHYDILADAFALEREVQAYYNNAQAVDIPPGLEIDHSAHGPSPRLDDGARQSETENDLDRHSLKQISVVYSCFALLILQRRVFLDNTSSVRVQHTFHNIRHHITALPAACFGSNSVHSACAMPFYLAAREAASNEDRTWVRDTHSRWIKVFVNPARPRLMTLIERSWAARDGHDRGLNRYHDGDPETLIAYLEESDTTFIL